MRACIVVADTHGEVDAMPAGDEYKAHTILVRDGEGMLSYTVRKSRVLTKGVQYSSLLDALAAVEIGLRG